MSDFLPIEKLRGWSKNPRGIKKLDYERLKRQVQRHGQFKPLIVTEDGEVIGGNMRLKVYQDLGIKEAWVSIVSVKDETEKVAIALADNDRAGYYEEEYLAELLMSVPDLVLEDYHLDLGKTLSAKDLLDKFRPTEEDEFDVESELPDEPVSKLGDVYQLGNHRLMCGDSTVLENVTTLLEGKQADLVFTDPPYGIDVVQGKKIGGGGPTKFGKVVGGKIVDSTTYSTVIGDDSTETAKASYEIARSVSERFILWGGNYFTDFLPVSRCWIIWNKENTGNFADGEIAWTNLNGGVKIYKHLWNGLSREGDRKTELVKRVHPTQKPVGLHGDILKDFTKDGDSILDLFGGSGSTLIACEQLGRSCYMMELDPRYCDVIVKRWEQFTGNKAELITVN